MFEETAEQNSQVRKLGTKRPEYLEMSEVCRDCCLFNYLSADTAEEFSILQVFQTENRQAEYLLLS